MSERFYLNCPLSPGPIEMTGPEAHHLARVSRLRAGDPLCLFNGDGHEYPARVVATSRKSVCLEVLGVATPQRELERFVEIAAPLPKGDRAQFLVEKLTELGVASFVPLRCQRSIVEPHAGKIDKLGRYVIEASKQCGRNVLLQIAEPLDWADYCRRGEAGEVRMVAHLTGTAPGVLQAAPRVRCALGPEGGFTDEEMALALAQGWSPVSLGPRILRVETAALVMALHGASQS